MRGRENRRPPAPVRRVRTIAVLAALITFCLLAAGTGRAAGGSIVSWPPSVSSRAFLKPWTPERMRDATPYPLPGRKGGPAAMLPAEAKASRGIPGSIPGRPPAVPASPLPAPGDAGDRQAAPPAYSYPAPFTRYRNFASYSTYPYLTVGKLFFVQNGRDFVCSAAVIGTDAIWTAGHCVHDGSGTEDGWSSDVLFMPAYLDGAFPFGEWRASVCRTTDGWYNSNGEDFRFDMGGCVMQTDSEGRSLGDVVGVLGFAWNQPVEHHWFDVGYPAASPFPGTRQYVCAASYAYSDASSGAPEPVAIGCDQTAGCSGGPWIWKFGTENVLNGHNSYRYTDHPKEMYSPYFGDDARSLYDLLITPPPP